MLKVLAVLSSLITVWAQVPLTGRAYLKPDETPKPYDFSYVAEAIGGQSSRQESGDASGRVVGQYSLSDEDGRRRLVKYVADQDGFRAVVETNEPGTKSDNPANVEFYSSAVEGAAPPPRPRPPVTPQPTQSSQERPTTVRPYYDRRPFYDRRPYRRPYTPYYLQQPYAPLPQYVPL